MKKFIVFGHMEDNCSCIVEAHSDVEAMDKAERGELLEEWDNDSPWMATIVVDSAQAVKP